MTYRDLDKVLSRLEERESSIGQALDTAMSRTNSVEEDLGFMKRALDVFDNRQYPQTGKGA